MSESLWFVMPCHERVELTALCLEQLAVTCDELQANGLDATCVVVTDDEPTLATARDLDFWTVEQENMPLGRKFNDGVELAGQQGADYIVPIGSDNWIDPALVLAQIPKNENEIGAHTLAVIVHEDGDRLCHIRVTYAGGDGIRTFPRALLEPLGFRPAADGARRAVDTSIVERLRRGRAWRSRYAYVDLHPNQVVSWQSHSKQLNDYASLKKGFGVGESFIVWEELERHWDPVMLARMRKYLATRPRS